LDPFPERLAKPAHVETQASLIDHGVGPDLLDQLPLSDHLTGTADEQYQYVQGAPAERDGLPILRQQPLTNLKSEGPE
jgi:hypothetical protein